MDDRPAPSPSGVNWFLNLGDRHVKIDAAEWERFAAAVARHNATVEQARQESERIRSGAAGDAKRARAKRLRERAANEAKGGLFE